MHHLTIVVSSAIPAGGGLAVGGCRDPEQGNDLDYIWTQVDRGPAKDAASYYIQASESGGEPPGHWWGPGAKALGFSQGRRPDGSGRIAPGISISQMRAIDLIVCGSVAVNEHGARLGKGAGYSDIEAALLAEAGLLTQQTIIATTVHDLQVLDEDLPEQPHDFRVDLIVTPERTIWPGHPKRPEKLDLDSLSPGQIAAIPVLAQRLRR